MCHQTVSLVARHLEANGIPTVVLGSALDIVEHCRVPRFAFLDFPLGNPCGKPYDVAMQRDVVGAALELFESESPQPTLRLPQRWHEGEDWRDAYMEIREEDVAALRQRGEERRVHRQALRDAGRVRAE